MAWVHLVLALALLQFIVFALLVGYARGRYGIHAPATTGNVDFERYFRVQQNTLEMLIVWVPSMLIAAGYWSPVWIAGIGAVYVIGRVLYAHGYIREAGKRSTGFLLSFSSVIVLLLAALVGAVRALF